jgi:hypothetical protein
MLSALANNETTYRSVMGTVNDARDYYSVMTGIANNFVTTIFGANGEARTNFQNELTAYRLGKYILQKCRLGDTAFTSTASDFQTALAGLSYLGLPTLVAGNVDDILTIIETSLTGRINAAMGVDSITDSEHRTLVQGLNANLVTQIGEDLAEFKALIDDYKDIGMVDDVYTSWVTWPEIVAQGETQQTRAAELAAGFAPYTPGKGSETA